MAVQILNNKIIAKPNNSLTTEDGLKLLIVMLLVVLLITLSFASRGAWLVLPFAGLELMAFCYAFYSIYTHANDFESVTIDAENVRVEQRIKNKVTSTVFKRYWAQVNLKQDQPVSGLFAKSKIMISSHGEEVEFGGRLVTEAQRQKIVQELKQKIKNIT
jgi:uncharacterized membrane protein